MNITDAYDMIDKYNLREKANVECRKRKIDKAPYDVSGHNKVYSDLLGKIWIELRKKRDAKLKELGITIFDETEDDDIINWSKEMEDIVEAQEILLVEAEKDFYLK